MTDKIEVSQRARDTAAKYYEHRHPADNTLPDFMRDGKADGSMTVQAFARFERDILATRTPDPMPAVSADGPVEALGNEDAVLTIRAKVTHHPDELNTVQCVTETHLTTGKTANPYVVWDAIMKAIGHENAQFLKTHNALKSREAI